LAEGEFTPENQLKLKSESEREKSKLDPWKLKHFEPIWGNSCKGRQNISNQQRPALKTTIKLRPTASITTSTLISKTTTSPPKTTKSPSSSLSSSSSSCSMMQHLITSPKRVRTVGAMTRSSTAATFHHSPTHSKVSKRIFTFFQKINTFLPQTPTLPDLLPIRTKSSPHSLSSSSYQPQPSTSQATSETSTTQLLEIPNNIIADEKNYSMVVTTSKICADDVEAATTSESILRRTSKRSSSPDSDGNTNNKILKSSESSSATTQQKEEVRIEDEGVIKLQEKNVIEEVKDEMLMVRSNSNDCNTYNINYEETSTSNSEHKSTISISNYSENSQIEHIHDDDRLFTLHEEGAADLTVAESEMDGNVVEDCGEDGDNIVINEDVQFSTCDNILIDENVNATADLGNKSPTILLDDDDDELPVEETETESLYNSNLKELQDVHLEQFADADSEIVIEGISGALTLITDSSSTCENDATAEDLEPSIQNIEELEHHQNLVVVESDTDQIEEKFTDAENYVLESLTSGEIIVGDTTGEWYFLSTVHGSYL
jgi:hypothetical protein